MSNPEKNHLIILKELWDRVEELTQSSKVFALQTCVPELNPQNSHKNARPGSVHF